MPTSAKASSSAAMTAARGTEAQATAPHATAESSRTIGRAVIFRVHSRLLDGVLSGVLGEQRLERLPRERGHPAADSRKVRRRVALTRPAPLRSRSVERRLEGPSRA